MEKTVTAENNAGQEYMTDIEAADFMRVSKAVLVKWRTIGYGPKFKKFGARVVYTKTDINTWAESKTYSNTAEIKHQYEEVGR